MNKRNTETNVMTEKNTSQEHLRHTEKKRNTVNVVFDRSQNFMDLHHPRSPQQNFID